MKQTLLDIGSVLHPVAKGLVSGLISAATTFAVASQDEVVNSSEWAWIAVSFLTGLGIVQAIPHYTPPPKA